MSKSLPKRGAAGPARANEAACTQAPMSPARPVGPRPAAQLLAAQRQLGNQAALQMLQAAGASRPVSSGGPVMQMLRVPTQSQSLKGLLGEQYGVQIEALQGEGRSTSKLDAILEKRKNLSAEKAQQASQTTVDAPTPSVSVADQQAETEIKETKQEEEEAPANDRPTEKYTTVGLEFEFAQFEAGQLLQGVSHLEVAKSSSALPYSKEHFLIETDADRALELVTPPFLVNTISDDVNVPDPAQVKHVSDIIDQELKKAKKAETVGKMMDALEKSGLAFDRKNLDKEIEIEPGHLSTEMPLNQYEKLKKNKWKATLKEILDMPMAKSFKKGNGKPQINIATDALTVHEMRADADAGQTESTDHFKIAMDTHKTEIESVVRPAVSKLLGKKEPQPEKSSASGGKKSKHPLSKIEAPAAEYEHASSKQAEAYVAMIVDSIAYKILEPSLMRMREIQEELYTSDRLPIEKSNVDKNSTLGELMPETGSELNEVSGITSYVKDLSALWLKDNIANVTMGIFNSDPGIVAKLGGLFMNEGFIGELLKVTTAQSLSGKEQRKQAAGQKNKNIGLGQKNGRLVPKE
ncbi:DUF1631 domain-containing protein [Cohnella ginsengisoli]|uniref:DUF1631 domain-containing protein n=1 Tax=Cohnella ginsengisoli TaxID=425004 RepID=A0A9X4KS03_9BACL|nr:hypothetical protein [Cohnella ginsengisoli]MDG0795062.1 DUF1631 domain-containing protein [Cohnella ginsengisoli]